jgi:hypothetical protein
MTLSVAGPRRDAGVSVAKVNLKFIRDVLSQTEVGRRGQAYLVDAQGRLIAHPEISLVLLNTDMSKLAQVQAARRPAEGASSDTALEQVQVAQDIRGHKVLTAYAKVPSLGWLVFVELPVGEAYAPLYSVIERSFGPLLAGLTLAFFGIAWFSGRSRQWVSGKMAGPAKVIE